MFGFTQHLNKPHNALYEPLDKSQKVASYLQAAQTGKPQDSKIGRAT